MSLPSLELVATEVRAEREAQMRHFEGLDTKAGIVLGFAGALVALAGPRTVAVDIGLSLAVAAGLSALWAMLPRRFRVLELGLLRDRYLAAEPEFTALFLLDTHVVMARQMSETLHRKAVRLQVAVSFLAAAVILLAIDALVL